MITILYCAFKTQKGKSAPYLGLCPCRGFSRGKKYQDITHSLPLVPLASGILLETILRQVVTDKTYN